MSLTILHVRGPRCGWGDSISVWISKYSRLKNIFRLHFLLPYMSLLTHMCYICDSLAESKQIS